MRKNRIYLVLLAVLLGWGCDDEVIDAGRVTGITLDITEKTVIAGDAFKLVATVYPENADNKEVKWRSSNEKIATVDANGNVTTLSEGEVRITAVTRDRALTARCVVTVQKRIFPVTGVAIEPAEMTVTVGDLFTLVAQFTPENATNKNVVWKSSNDEIIEVNAEGVVLAKKAGVATITVTTEDGGKTAQCVITVEKAKRPKLSIEYVAEYNLNAEGTGFATSHANDASGYFTWDDAIDRFTAEKNFAIDGYGFHLPTQQEWLSIVPAENRGNNVQFQGESATNDYSETVTVAGETMKVTADYRGTTNGVAYALRFKGEEEKHRSAWRYEFADNPSGGNMLKITVRYLGPDRTDVTVDDIAKETWWSQDADEDIVRNFPAAGYHDGNKVNANNQGTYWSATEAKNTARGMRLYFKYDTANGSSNQAKTLGFSVRLFSDN